MSAACRRHSVFESPQGKVSRLTDNGEKWEYKGTVHQLFIDFKKAYDSVKREVLYDILIEFGIPKKLVRLIKMCLSETYSRVRIGISMLRRCCNFSSITLCTVKKKQRCPHLFIFLEETVLPSARTSRASACLPTHVKTDSNATIVFRYEHKSNASFHVDRRKCQQIRKIVLTLSPYPDSAAERTGNSSRYFRLVHSSICSSDERTFLDDVISNQNVQLAVTDSEEHLHEYDVIAY
ncbi:hypothetical protein ANN_00602 [Periplaneta americana]|uniref:Reverse transcriptase domain-containing protein n=1 Tax=Periplaneta americana TaxID=6978 RepID=A0ABQ8TV90_PERAM|nr:hypothetical protein ANN_00602 [Periplaneta americana]